MQTILRQYSTADDLNEHDLKSVKERMETVGIESSRLLAAWMKDSLGLELKIGEADSSDESDEQFQMKRKEVIDNIVKRVREELGPIAGVDPMFAREAGGGTSAGPGSDS